MDKSNQPKYTDVQSAIPERPSIQQRVDELNHNHRMGIVDKPERNRNLTAFLKKNVKK